MTRPALRSVHVLGSHPMLFGAVTDQLDAAKQRGEFPGRVRGADRDDACLYYGEDGDPIAFVTWHDTDLPLTWWLDVVLVQPSYRRQRIAKRLIGSVVRLARMNNCNLRCGINEDNFASRALFGAAGFVPHHIVYALPPRETTPCK